MSKSPLTDVVVRADSSNYTSGRYSDISEITIHHMAGVLSAEQCGYIFQRPGRNGSSHYGIGNDGRIGNYVDEDDTAWTNSNWESNCRAITIETSNCECGGDWPVSDDALNSLIRLVADISKRYGIKLIKGDTVTWHSMYAATECPGDYLRSKIDYIIEEANKINGDDPSPSPDYTGVITYQAYSETWLPEVHKCDDTYEGFAGIGNVPMTGLRAKPQYGEIYLQAHIKGGSWLDQVSSANYYDGSYNSYAGLLGQPMDMIKIDSSEGFVDYRVKTLEDGWLPWVNSKTKSGTESYAGIPNHTIIGIQMK